VKPRILAAVFVSTLLLAVAYGSAFLPGGAPSWAPWLMVVGTAGLMVSTMSLGATRGKRLRRLALPFALVFLILVVGFGAVLLSPAEGPGNPLWLGLPPRAAIVLYGVGLLPLLAVPLVYALTFDAVTLSAADLERVRRAAAALQTHGRDAAAPDPAGPGKTYSREGEG
jgi:amino acid transporter